MKKILRNLLVLFILFMGILSFFLFGYYAVMGKKLMAVIFSLQGILILALAAEVDMDSKVKGKKGDVFFQIEEDENDYTDEEYLYFYGKPRQ